MGCEMYDLCEECRNEWRKENSGPNEGRCDWCKKWAEDRFAERDIDEGMHGPVYYVCAPCRTRYHKALQEEMDQFLDDIYDPYDEPDYDPFEDEYWPQCLGPEETVSIKSKHLKAVDNAVARALKLKNENEVYACIDAWIVARHYNQ